MFTRVIGILAGLFLAIMATKYVNPDFSLDTWLASLSTLGR
jgi:hypothetical protein